MQAMTKSELKAHNRNLTKMAAQVGAEAGSLTLEQKDSITESLAGIWLELQGAQSSDPDEISPAQQMVQELAELSTAVVKMDQDLKARDNKIMEVMKLQIEAIQRLQDHLVVHLNQQASQD